MRELKFRIWTGEKMVRPDYISRNGTAHYKQDKVPVISEDIMQWTGLKDKNGVDIFENDFVVKPDSKQNASEVIFKEGQWYPFANMSDCSGKSIVIVGNRFASPELVKEDE